MSVLLPSDAVLVIGFRVTSLFLFEFPLPGCPEAELRGSLDRLFLAELLFDAPPPVIPPNSLRPVTAIIGYFNINYGVRAGRGRGRGWGGVSYYQEDRRVHIQIYPIYSGIIINLLSGW